MKNCKWHFMLDCNRLARSEYLPKSDLNQVFRKTAKCNCYGLGWSVSIKDMYTSDALPENQLLSQSRSTVDFQVSCGVSYTTCMIQ